MMKVPDNAYVLVPVGNGDSLIIGEDHRVHYYSHLRDEWTPLFNESKERIRAVITAFERLEAFASNV